jgi:hypothetical protein
MDNIMENWTSFEEQEKRKEKALENHARLHRLFVEDRLSFERERKRTIDEFINSVKDDAQRENLRALQDSWDRKMRNAGSKHNSFVLAQTLFWEHFNEVFQPTMQKFSTISSSID